jgi:crotonobetainyl-CoA:carnitine CoA-transferase CaiB-like acyl-CoA transferase
MANALQGIKVVDVSQVAAVPMAARHLADFGAEVIHIEHPTRGDSWRSYQEKITITSGRVPSKINSNWENYNRNKKSVTIDISKEGGQAILHKIIENADVFLSNLRPFELKRYNLEYNTLKQINPRLIYGAFTAYGKEGPQKDAPGYDTIAYWSRSGLTQMLSLPGISAFSFRPAQGDNVAALAFALGVVLALYVRQVTGVGQEVDISLFHTALYQMSYDTSEALVTKEDGSNWESRIPQELIDEANAVITRLRDAVREQSLNPLIQGYFTKDGREILLAILQSDRYWSAFCSAIERKELENDPRFDSTESRAQNHVELYYILKDAFKTRDFAEWKERLTQAAIPGGPVQNILEVINDVQARANDFFIPVDHPTYGRIEVLANPVKLSETPATIRMPAPEFSQHTEEVLLEAGYTWDDIRKFKQEGLIT